MFEIKNKYDREKNYKYMVLAIKDLLENEQDEVANFSNISSFINVYMDKINWVGFYFMKDGELVLGPFQGGPACIRIKVGNGVCGTCVEQKKVMIVKNVHEFPGHIACDSNTNSEIVLPITVNDKVYGVLDIDSPEFERFDELEEKFLMEVVKLIENFLSR